MVKIRAKIVWTFGTMLIVVGLYLLLYVGGLYANAAYNRLAARGDNEITPPLARVLAAEEVPAAFTVPVLAAQSTSGSESAISALPATVPGQQALVSRVVIPSIGIDSKVVEVGWDVAEENGQQVAIWQVAEYAVGQHKGSANPGEGENVVLAGHVGGYGKVFKDLFYVNPGDTVVLYSDESQYRYTISEKIVVDEEGVPTEQRLDNARYIQPQGQEVVTLLTCWPESGPNRFTQRIIVRAVPFGGEQVVANAAVSGFTIR